MDFLLIPGGRGNLTRFGNMHCILKIMRVLCNEVLFDLGATYDRFCGGQLNTESAEEESIPIYTEITSPVIWLQVSTLV